MALSSMKFKSQTSDSYYKSELEMVSKENRKLKQRIEQLEQENRDLKKSVYDLNIKYNSALQHIGKSAKPFDIESSSSVEVPPTAAFDEISETSSQLLDKDGTASRSRTRGSQMESINFQQKIDFRGHTGAVYVTRFSPCGRFLASGSFDRTVAIWDMEKQKQSVSLQQHQLSVFDVAWSSDSTELLSAGFDRCVKSWDLASGAGAGRCTSSFAVGGFAQCVVQSPADANIFSTSDTQKHVYLFDKRQQQPIHVIENESMVNTLHIHQSGQVMVTGDQNGFIKTWDLRRALSLAPSTSASGTPITASLPSATPLSTTPSGAGPLSVTCVDVRANDDRGLPISHIHACRPLRSGDEEGRFMAVNSYDNVLRIYDRGSFVSQSKPVYGLHQQLTGHKNKNWPIRSSFFVGREYDFERSRRKDVVARSGNVHSSLLIASGSADNYAYIFDISGVEGSGMLVQKLEGHSENVYCVDFHPSDPVLATCSGDFLVKIWIARG